MSVGHGLARAADARMDRLQADLATARLRITELELERAAVLRNLETVLGALRDPIQPDLPTCPACAYRWGIHEGKVVSPYYPGQPCPSCRWSPPAEVAP